MILHALFIQSFISLFYDLISFIRFDLEILCFIKLLENNFGSFEIHLNLTISSDWIEKIYFLKEFDRLIKNLL